jgi:Trypsin
VKSRFLILTAAALAVLVVAAPSQAITSGERDHAAHPYVGFARNMQSSCSATAVSARLVITAAHCFTFPTDTAWVNFDDNFRTNPFPSSSFHKGTWHPDPQFCRVCKPGLVGLDTHDIAVIVLDEPVSLASYGALPALGLADRLGKGTEVTSVGYGAQELIPSPGGKVGVRDGFRMRAQSTIVSDKNSIANEFLKLSANPSGANGGTCYGDSGGPNLQSGTNVVLGINSFGPNGNCAGVTYSYRADTASARAFLAPWVALYG